MTGIASSATAVLVAHVAARTETMRVGSGGIMLPNHAPLVVAEQFGTLAALHPGRIDLGVGRAPGCGQRTARALRREAGAAERFGEELAELRGFLAPAEPDQGVQAVPGAGADVPVWVLGSSPESAALAGDLGLPYAFASHFAPDALDEALARYREHFTPSAHLARPCVMVAVNVLVAHTDAEARHQFSSVQQQFLRMIRGRQPGPLPAPTAMDRLWREDERERVEAMLAVRAVGTAGTVARELNALLARTGADELMVSTQTLDPAATLRSYELLAGVRGQLAHAPGR
jgi:luciferase family oxidoreductase group 1